MVKGRGGAKQPDASLGVCVHASPWGALSHKRKSKPTLGKFMGKWEAEGPCLASLRSHPATHSIKKKKKNPRTEPYRRD